VQGERAVELAELVEVVAPVRVVEVDVEVAEDQVMASAVA
jgi:hypothetical protein